MRLLAFCLAMGLTVARAEPTGELEARAVFKEANRLLEAGSYVEALDLFRSAYAKFPSVKILLNIGTTLRQLGRFAEAADTYDKYLADPKSDPARKADVRKILGELDRQVGHLTLAPSEPDAHVFVDGRVIEGRTRVRLDAGAHAIVAEKSGFTSVTATVSIAGGEDKTVELRLLPPQAERPIVTPEPIAPAPVATAQIERRPSRGKTIAGAVLTGLGLAMAGTGIAFGVLAQRAGDDVTQLDRAMGTYDPGQYHDGQRDQTLMGVFVGLGAAATVAGAIVLALGRRGARR